MRPSAPAHPFQALDACHVEIQKHLLELQRMAQQMAGAGLSAADRALAGQIAEFFSSTSREHHAQEESQVFPQLLASSDAVLVAAVRSLQQDHGFIEENWTILGPQLHGIAQGNDWFLPEEFQHNVATFLALLGGHIALEESLIYPESKAQWAAAVAARQARLAA